MVQNDILTWVLSVRGPSQWCKGSFCTSSMLLDAALLMAEIPCLSSAGGEITFSLSLSPLDFSDSAATGAFVAKAVDRDRTGLPRWTVSQPSASFRSMWKKTHSQRGTHINRSIRNNYFITVLHKLWEKNFFFKNQYQKIDEIFFSKAFYLQRYYRHWTTPLMGHVLLLQSEATQTQKGVGNGNMYLSLPCFFLAISRDDKAQQSNYICSSLQQQ